jgi:uncharacterized membrane protein
MVAGLNTRVRIWRMEDIDDDDVGGAVISGTVAYTDIRARIEANPQEQLLLQQGLETERTFNALIVPGTYDIRERDELEVTAPSTHPYYSARFRIVGIQFSSMDASNPNNYARLTMTRSVRSHAVQ